MSQDNTYYHFGTPDFFVTSSTVQTSDLSAKLFLDINTKNIILGVYYLVEGPESVIQLFSQFAKFMESKSIDAISDFIEYEQEQFFPLVFMMYNQAINKWKGTSKAFCDLNGMDSAQLLCRCFGVYKSEILNLVYDNPKINLKEITGKLKAGGGCTSCLEDIKNLISEARQTYGIYPEHVKMSDRDKKLLIDGKTPASLLLEIEPIYTEWLRKKAISRSDFKIVKFDGIEMFAQIAPRPDREELIQDLQSEIRKKLSSPFKISSLIY